MSRRCVEVIDVVEILQHWYARRSNSQIAGSVGADRGTVAKYVAPAVAAGMVPGGPPVCRDEWVVLVRGWFPELVDAKARSLTYPEIDRLRSVIEPLIGQVTVATLFQRLRDEHGLGCGVTAFRQYVRLEFGSAPRAEAVTLWRPPVVPGSEAQIDYGFLGSWLDPVTDRLRRVWAFVMVLACSRRMFVRPVLSMNSASWIQTHVDAFEFFGAVPARLVPDNLRTGVDRPDLYDPKINRGYAEMAEHYGCLVDPARAFKPKDKARVERPMPYIRDSFWRGRMFNSLDEMQAAATVWCRDVAGVRQHRSLERAAPVTIFETIEKPAMAPLPHHDFEVAVWSRPKVAPDCHIAVGGVLYSVPWRYLGVTVDARLSARRLEVFVDSTLIKTHVRITKGRSTDMADYPPEKIAFFQRTPTWCRRQAAEYGPNVTAVVNELLDINVLHRLRAVQGILGLADKYCPQRLDAACAKALKVGDPSYRTIKGILTAGTETNDLVATVAPCAPAHLHGPAVLFNPSDTAGEVA
jgi:Integrase core domain